MAGPGKAIGHNLRVAIDGLLLDWRKWIFVIIVGYSSNTRLRIYRFFDDLIILISFFLFVAQIMCHPLRLLRPIVSFKFRLGHHPSINWFFFVGVGLADHHWIHLSIFNQIPTNTTFLPDQRLLPDRVHRRVHETHFVGHQIFRWQIFHVFDETLHLWNEYFYRSALVDALLLGVFEGDGADVRTEVTQHHFELVVEAIAEVVAQRLGLIPVLVGANSIAAHVTLGESQC